MAENKQKNPWQNFSDSQFPLPLPPLEKGVVLYCFDRRNILSTDETKSAAFGEGSGRRPKGERRAFNYATLAQQVEQLICNQ